MSSSEKYIDYFLMPLPKSEVAAYEEFGKGMAALARKHGAIDYINTIGDDVKAGTTTSFPQAVNLEEGEIVVCSIAIYNSRADRDKANQTIMQDPDMKKLGMPSGAKRLVTGGFRVIGSMT